MTNHSDMPYETAPQFRLTGSADPHNVEAERVVLGCLLMSAETWPIIFAAIEKRDFYIPKHGRIFTAMSNLFHSGDSIDYITVTAELMRAKQLEDSGGAEYLAGLTNQVPTPRNARHYSGIIKELSDLRQLQKFARNLISDIEAGTTKLSDLIQNAGAQFLELTRHKMKSSDPMSIIEALKSSDDYYRAIESGAILPPLKTGFRKLDRSVRLGPGDLFVIAARPSMGKTAFAVETNLRLLNNYENIRTLYLTCEMNPMRTAYRYLANDAGINLTSLIFGEHRNLANSVEAGRLREIGSRAKIAELMDASETEIQMVIRSEALRSKMPDVVFIDYLQNIHFSRRTSSMRENISAVSTSIKNIARTLKIPIVLVSQLSRDAENKRPSKAHLGESGKIEQDADWIALLHPQGEFEELMNSPVWDVRLYLDKAKDGATGTMMLDYNRPTGTFREVELPAA